jgi:hypothetical protein
MKYLMGFDQAKLLGKLSNRVNYGCCLAFSIEWVRLALYQYSSPLATGAETRAAVLTRQAPTIASHQDLCNQFNIMSGKPKPSTEDPNPKARISHQYRQCYILNIMGNQKDVLKKIDAALRSTEDSFGAKRYKKGAQSQDWEDLLDELVTPNTFHVLLMKGLNTATNEKWHHAIASWAYEEEGNKMAHLFDANYGEIKIGMEEFGQEIENVVTRCEKGSALHSLRFIRVEKGSGYTGGIDM